MNDKFYIMYEPANEMKLKAEFVRSGVHFNVEKDYDDPQIADVRKLETTRFPGLKTATIEGGYEKIISALPHVVYSAPYYRTDIGEGRLTHRFSIALKQETDVKILEELAKENSVEMLGVSEFDGWYELACTNLSAGNSLEMANLFYETGLFESVSYDLGARGEVVNINEPLYTNGTLWHLGNNTTNSSAHINYIAARAIIPQASSSVKIAVIDTGVQYDHSDLYNVQSGWEAETQSSPNVYSDNPHGTQVTGFIAARPNNGEAVAGVAYGATILPISFNTSSSGAILSPPDVLVRAFTHALQKGADIINCSWTYSDNRIVSAVKNALNNGCVVVFASGNHWFSSQF
jgi:hypothetical protein